MQYNDTITGGGKLWVGKLKRRRKHGFLQTLELSLIFNSFNFLHLYFYVVAFSIYNNNNSLNYNNNNNTTNYKYNSVQLPLQANHFSKLDAVT